MTAVSSVQELVKNVSVKKQGCSLQIPSVQCPLSMNSRVKEFQGYFVLERYCHRTAELTNCRNKAIGKISRLHKKVLT